MRRLAAALLVLPLALPAGAAVLKVGPGEALTVPSMAARVAGAGDTIEIAPGDYYDCAVWRQDGLTITGPLNSATPAVLTDAACHGKALFVIAGRGVTVRHLTFARVRVPDGNGAGIRAEGADLTVEHSRFFNNQSAILAADQPGGSLVVRDSVFERNGAILGERCVATLAINLLLHLKIENSRFFNTRACDIVRSVAARIDVLDSRFDDAPPGAAGHIAVLGGGALLVRGNRFVLGPGAGARDAVIDRRALWGAAGDALVQGNTLENTSGRPVALVHNLTSGTVRLVDNVIGPGDAGLDESGWWMARARNTARTMLDTGRAVAGKIKRGVQRLLPF